MRAVRFFGGPDRSFIQVAWQGVDDCLRRASQPTPESDVKGWQPREFFFASLTDGRSHGYSARYGRQAQNSEKVNGRTDDNTSMNSGKYLVARLAWPQRQHSNVCVSTKNYQGAPSRYNSIGSMLTISATPHAHAHNTKEHQMTFANVTRQRATSTCAIKLATVVNKQIRKTHEAAWEHSNITRTH